MSCALAKCAHAHLGPTSISEYCTWFDTIADAMVDDDPHMLLIEVGQPRADFATRPAVLARYRSASR